MLLCLPIPRKAVAYKEDQLKNDIYILMGIPLSTAFT